MGPFFALNFREPRGECRAVCSPLYLLFDRGDFVNMFTKIKEGFGVGAQWQSATSLIRVRPKHISLDMARDCEEKRGGI